MKHAHNVGFAACLALLMGVGLLVLDSGKKLEKSQSWLTHTYEVREAILALQSDITSAEGSRRAYLLKGDDADLAPYRSLAESADRQLGRLRYLTRDNPRQQRRLVAAASILKDILAQQAQSVALRAAVPGHLNPNTYALGGDLHAQLASITRAMAREEDQLLKARAESLRRSTLSVFGMTVCGILLAVLLLCWVVTLLRRQVKVRTRAEEELRVKSGILEAILASMADGVAVADPNGKFIHFNPAAERILGVGAVDAHPDDWSREYGCYYPDTVTPYPPERLPLYRATRGEEIRGEEIYILRPDGGIWIESTGNPLLTPGGENLGGVAVFRDKTDRKLAEREIERLNGQLQEQILSLAAANTELEAFSYSVSHDLRSPLRTISGFSEALIEDYEDRLDEEGRGHLARIRAASNRMGQLIDDMLTLSRVTRREMEPEAVDLSAIASAIVDDLRHAQPDRNVQIEIVEGITVTGDVQLLRSALENLLGNAWKFTSKKPDARIEFGCSRLDGGEWACYVRDNGAGFDPEYAHKLFGAFQRLHAMTEFAGTGVGLATVQRIVRRHGGSVWGEGRVGAGATFYFTLPRLTAAPSRTVQTIESIMEERKVA